VPAGVFQWLRAYYILGDDLRSQSLFSKILTWESEGRQTFPFTSGLNKYDFIAVQDLARQIAHSVSQTSVVGVIDCCSGQPVALRDKVTSFLIEHGLSIRPVYGAYPDRAYDSPAVWGSTEKIDLIMPRN
jgi:dTDP-6-deoxy-L-talose 4-dehydrogenase (NAD+)